MSSLAWLGLLTGGAALAILLLHRRTSSARRPMEFPSLQYVPGRARAFRLAGPLEEKPRLALRLLALVLLLTGFIAASRAPDPRLVAVVADPDSPGFAARADEIARDLERAGKETVVRLDFDGATLRVRGGGIAAERAREEAAILMKDEAGSAAPRLDRLRRAAAVVADRTVVVGAFEKGRFSERVRLPFEAEIIPPSHAAAPADAPRPRIGLLEGASPAARVWAAALAVESRGTLEDLSSIETAPPAMLVVASEAVGTASPAPILFAASALPAAESMAVEGLVYEPVARAFAGRSADAGRFSVSLPLRSSGRALARSASGDRVLLMREDAGASAAGARLVACGTEVDLGTLLHEGTLGRLCRVILGSLSIPISLVAEAGPPLTLDELKALGGTRFQAPSASGRLSSVSPALLLFSLALVVRLLDARPSTRTLWRALDVTLFAAAALCVLALVLDVRPKRVRTMLPMVRVLGAEGRPDAGSRALAERLAAATAGRAVVQQGRSLGARAPALARLEDPVELFVAPRGAPPRPPNAGETLPAPLLLVGDAREAWAAIAAVDAPDRASLERAAGIAVTVRASLPTAQSLVLRLSDRGGFLCEMTIPASAGARVFRAVLPFRAGTEGPRALAVSLDGAGAQDSYGFSLSVGAARRRIVVLSASPSWEGRAAARLLAADDVSIERWIRVGRTAELLRTSAVSQTSLGPSALAMLERIEPRDVIVLEGVGAGDLPPRVEARIASLVETGAHLLILGPPDREFEASPLGMLLPARFVSVDSSERPVILQGDSAVTGNSRALRFRGFPPSPAVAAPGATVLGTLGPEHGARRPWLVGRAIGKGRVLRVLAADLWRSESAETASLSRELLGWLTASGRDDGIPDDGMNELVRARRPRLRAAALAAALSYDETESLQEAVSAIERLPPRVRTARIDPRRSPPFAALLLALIVANVAVRRLRAAA
ncbi:MAG: hypothetical protein ABIQ65_01310 [Thermoanaerobaculia bacterium]